MRQRPFQSYQRVLSKLRKLEQGAQHMRMHKVYARHGGVHPRSLMAPSAVSSAKATGSGLKGSKALPRWGHCMVQHGTFQSLPKNETQKSGRPFKSRPAERPDSISSHETQLLEPLTKCVPLYPAVGVRAKSCPLLPFRRAIPVARFQKRKQIESSLSNSHGG